MKGLLALCLLYALECWGRGQKRLKPVGVGKRAEVAEDRGKDRKRQGRESEIGGLKRRCAIWGLVMLSLVQQAPLIERRDLFCGGGTLPQSSIPGGTC